MPDSGDVSITSGTTAEAVSIAVGDQSTGAETHEATLHVGVRSRNVRVGVQPQGSGLCIAKKLQTARRIGLTGDAAGGAYFDGSEDVNIHTAVERLTNEELEAMLV